MLSQEYEIKKTIVLRSLTGGKGGLKKFQKVPYVISERSLTSTEKVLFSNILLFLFIEVTKIGNNTFNNLLKKLRKCCLKTKRFFDIK